MDCILTREHAVDGGRIVQLSLNTGRGNPLTLEFIEALDHVLDELASDLPRALVIDGGDGRIFSGGFALPEIASWDRARLSDFFEGFMNVIYKIMSLNCPSIAALGGHAVAGGFILSLACDLRVVGQKGLKFGLSEVDLGVAVPAGTAVLLAARTSLQTSLRMSMFGQLIDCDTALSIGYADELAEQPSLRALQVAETLANKPGQGVSKTRSLQARPLIAAMQRAEIDGTETFLDTWFSVEGQTALHAMAERLSSSG